MSDGGVKKVLVVEDEQSHADMLIGAINRLEGYAVTENSPCCTVREAYSALEEEHPDILLLDLHIPFAVGFAGSPDDGAELGRTVAERWQDIKIVVCSGNMASNAVSLSSSFSKVVIEKHSLFTPGLNVLAAALDTAMAGGELIVAFDAELHRLREMQKYHLSAREWEILEATTKGMTNQEIARQLVIAKDTVETHLENAGKKIVAIDGGDEHEPVKVARRWAREHIVRRVELPPELTEPESEAR